MSIERKDDEGAGMVSFTVSGPFPLSELRALLGELYADRDTDLPKRYLWD